MCNPTRLSDGPGCHGDGGRDLRNSGQKESLILTPHLNIVPCDP